MPRSQPKVIFQAPKKKPITTLPTIMLQIALGFLLAFVILGTEILTSQNANAQQDTTATTSSSFFSNQILATPTPYPSLPFPVTQQITPSIEEGQITSEAAKIEPTPAFQDYCTNARIILYHHIQPLQIAEQLGHAPLTVDSDIFDDQMKYLHEHGYTAITSQQLIDALQTRGKLPDKSVMITIDDGYDDNYTYGFMIAKKYQMVMNFMIPTGLIGTPGYMNWDHLKEMSQNPYARLYNHTTSHAALDLISKEDVVKEITTANEDLKNKLGIKNDILTYPYGEYNDTAIEALKENHFVAAFTTEPGSTQCLSGIMKIPRDHIGNAPMTEYGF